MLEEKLSNASRKAELFGSLFSSIEKQYGWQSESVDNTRFDEWKASGLIWEKEITSTRLILNLRLGDQIGRVECGASISEPFLKFSEPLFLSQIYNKVWTHFENLPPEESKDVGRDQVVCTFEKIISTYPDLPEKMKEAYLECLKEPFRSCENSCRRVVGLDPIEADTKPVISFSSPCPKGVLLEGGEDGSKEV